MTIFQDLYQDGTTSTNLASEKTIVQTISAYTMQNLTLPHIEEATRLDVSKINIRKGELILENLIHHDKEKEDSILATSPVLEQLKKQAKQESTTLDWERELDEL